jgi:hypothetical protein
MPIPRAPTTAQRRDDFADFCARATPRGRRHGRSAARHAAPDDGA